MHKPLWVVHVFSSTMRCRERRLLKCSSDGLTDCRCRSEWCRVWVMIPRQLISLYCYRGELWLKCSRLTDWLSLVLMWMMQTVSQDSSTVDLRQLLQRSAVDWSVQETNWATWVIEHRCEIDVPRADTLHCTLLRRRIIWRLFGCSWTEERPWMHKRLWVVHVLFSTMRCRERRL